MSGLELDTHTALRDDDALPAGGNPAQQADALKQWLLTEQGPAPAMVQPQAPAPVAPPAPAPVQPVAPAPVVAALPAAPSIPRLEAPGKPPSLKMHPSTPEDFGFAVQVKDLQNQGLSFKDAVIRLVGPAPAPVQPAAPVAQPVAAPAPATPAPSTALAEQLATLNAALITATTETFDGAEATRLHNEIATLQPQYIRALTQESLAEASQQQVAQQQQLTAQAQFEQTYDAAAAALVPVFPGLDVPGSPMHDAYEAELNRAIASNDPILASADGAPIVLAQRAAKALGTAPVAPAYVPPPVSSSQPPAAIRPPVPVSFPGIVSGPGNGAPSALVAQPTPADLMASKDAWAAQEKLNRSGLPAGAPLDYAD